ncbi:MAG: hypothetical protein JWR19_98 [Pedosphaera sp.]|nr:hypothetical protein [Pedosphaera sp.]
MLLLLTVCFSLATMMEVRRQNRNDNNRQPAAEMDSLVGDSRRIFANTFFVKADAYFHSGFYPTIFDNQESFKTAHMAADAGAAASKNQGDETAFMGKPHDFIEAFSRDFMPSHHTHLDEGGAKGPGGDLGEASGGKVREILPWLQLSMELDPHRIETYTVTAYWLRNRMGKDAEAEECLRAGLAANPGSYAILYELGRIYDENRKDKFRARNLWEAALRNCEAQKAIEDEQGKFIGEQISTHLAKLEEDEGNYAKAMSYLEIAKGCAVAPEVIQARIDELRQKATGAKDAGAATKQP